MGSGPLPGPEVHARKGGDYCAQGAAACQGFFQTPTQRSSTGKRFVMFCESQPKLACLTVVRGRLCICLRPQYKRGLDAWSAGHFDMLGWLV